MGVPQSVVQFAELVAVELLLQVPDEQLESQAAVDDELEPYAVRT